MTNTFHAMKFSLIAGALALVLAACNPPPANGPAEVEQSNAAAAPAAMESPTKDAAPVPVAKPAPKPMAKPKAVVKPAPKELLANPKLKVVGKGTLTGWDVSPPNAVSRFDGGGIELSPREGRHTIAHQSVAVPPPPAGSPLPYHLSVECQGEAGCQFSLALSFNVNGKKQTRTVKYEANGEWQTLAIDTRFHKDADFGSMEVTFGLNKASTAPVHLRNATFYTK